MHSTDESGSNAQDIINGAFKGFAMLRQTAYMLNDPLAPPFDPPLYVPRYGFVARNQVLTHHVSKKLSEPTLDICCTICLAQCVLLQPSVCCSARCVNHEVQQRWSWVV